MRPCSGKASDKAQARKSASVRRPSGISRRSSISRLVAIGHLVRIIARKRSANNGWLPFDVLTAFVGRSGLAWVIRLQEDVSREDSKTRSDGRLSLGVFASLREANAGCSGQDRLRMFAGLCCGHGFGRAEQFRI